MTIPRLLPVALALTLSAAPAFARTPETLTFPSLDGLRLTADFYVADASPATPMIVLFHQAGWSRGEYQEIAPKLVKLGFNCLAVDQRSGGDVNGITNESARRAKAKKLETSYIDARQDVVAALRYAREHYAQGSLLAWGSSYSSSLVLQIAGSENIRVDGVLSFSPGEYFAKQGRRYVTDASRNVKVPVFVTSSKREAKALRKLFDAIRSDRKVHFVPGSPGQHGSRALWSKFSDNDVYWSAVTGFLDNHFPRGS